MKWANPPPLASLARHAMAAVMVRLTPSLFSAAIAVTLAGCGADTVNYPSLARRPAERMTGTAPVVPADPAPIASPAPPSAALTARLAQLVDAARAADAQFKAREAKARQLTNAATGTALASESWSVATIALADLESARSNAMIALADLDALYAATRISGGDISAIAAARDQVIGLVGTEDKLLIDLRGRLAS